MQTLVTALSFAVPLCIAEWKRQGGPQQSDYEELRGSGGILKMLLEKGDILLYGGGKKHECEKIFDKTAQAIAIMSFLPGGIEIFGKHWETA
jgi:hypothetical protein